LAEANAFMGDEGSPGKHRHHKPVQGHRFSIGAEVGGKLVGVATVGRPVAPKTDKKFVAEVTRLATDGTKNACSFLYAKAARIAQEMAFTKIQTFILQSEPGTSLKAAGWTCEGITGQGDWTNRPGRRTDQPTEPKMKWSKKLT
jgi:hypothetical protein